MSFHSLAIHTEADTRSNAGNCYLWGCLGLVVVAMAALALTALGVRYGYRQYEKYTDAAPLHLPIVEVDESDVNTLVDRVDAYMEGLREGSPLDVLVLDQRDINILIQHHPDLEKVRDWFYIAIEDDVVRSQVSVPLDEIVPIANRYFNGSATFDIDFRRGRLELYVIDAELNGEPLPDEVLDDIRSKNLAREVERNHRDAEDTLDALADIEVKDGAITFTPKNLKEAQEVEEASSAAA